MTGQTERLAATERLLTSIKVGGPETEAEQYLADEVARLLDLLAEKDATIQRVRDKAMEFETRYGYSGVRKVRHVVDLVLYALDGQGES